jgi:acetyl esterase/lipase
MHRSTVAFVCLQLLVACTLTSCARTGALRAGQPAAQPFVTPAQADDLEDLEDVDSSAATIALPAGAKVVRDVVYGPDAAQRMDVYLPQHLAEAPVIFMIHGGGWRRGDKAMGSVVTNKAARWLPLGYVVVSVNYRLAPQVGPLEQADDVALALAFAQSKADLWGADPARFVLMGHSAGAHLVALLAADPGIASRQHAQPWLGTVALDSAAFDVVQIMERPHFPLYDPIFKDDPALWRAASPLHRLANAPAPMLLVCSSKRRDSCPQAQTFADKATALGGQVTVLPVDLTHRGINLTLGQDGAYTDSVESFLRSLGLP